MRFCDKDSYVLVEFCEMIVGKQKPCEGMKNLMLKDLDDWSGSEGNQKQGRPSPFWNFGELVILPELKNLESLQTKHSYTQLAPSWKFCLLSVLAAATFSTTKQSLSLSV